MKKIASLLELENLRKSIEESSDGGKPSVAVCCGTGCRASGALEVAEAFAKALAAVPGNNGVSTKLTGCHGFCEQGPLVAIYPAKTLYCKVTVKDVPEIVERTLLKGEVMEHLLFQDPVSKDRFLTEDEVPFYRGQKRILLRDNGKMDPTDLRDYLAAGGYRGLQKALGEMDPQEIIGEIKASGLRGRGGGGFPTALKWEYCRQAGEKEKYLICNADEGDPGCFQDRSILEGNPHLVLEGMIIGAYAVGASRGYIYVRNEYPLAISHFARALDEARKYGLLGENILGSGFSFDVKISRGGGAFVCGEETALISSIEGISGEPNPRPRPPYPAQSGLWGKPTLINNVKTWATVPLVIREGAGWFASIGTEKSKGTMIFSLTGKVNNTGLVEVPMGMTLRELVYDIGGGIPGGRKFKAVQTGGPAGGCIPEELLDLPLDYEKLAGAGSMMGSGGMIVMDEKTCMVDVARFFLAFTQDESCGKCIPCREGGKQLLQLLENITAGKGREEDLLLMEEIAGVMQDGSLCALGRLAPNPVLTTLRYFRHEYLAHVREKRCPAGTCRALITFSIQEDLCTGCGRCLKNCPAGAISGAKKELHKIDGAKCTRCGACLEVCRFGAVLVQ